MRPADPVGLGVAAVGAAVVTAVCAVASYSHISHLATIAGQGELAGWLPLGVDGLITSSTASLLVDRRAGRPTGLSTVLGLVLGLVGSFAANLVAVDPTLVPMSWVRLALGGYPPLALAISGDVLLTMLLGSAVGVEGTTFTVAEASAVDEDDEVDLEGGELALITSTADPLLPLAQEVAERAGASGWRTLAEGLALAGHQVSRRRALRLAAAVRGVQ